MGAPINQSAPSETTKEATPKSPARSALEVSAPLATADELRSLVKLFRAGILILRDSFNASREN
jgi:hypothetical protein